MSRKRYMKEGLGLSFALGLLVFSAGADGAKQVTAPTASPMPMFAPAPSVSPFVSPSPEPVASPEPTPITQEDQKTLLREFNRALHAESRALDHRYKFELKDLSSSQTARKREWEAREREARREFFAKNEKGAERRAYIQDFLERRKALHKMMAEEKRERIRAQDVRKKSLRDDQQARFMEFQEFLKRGERPPERLWPQPGT